MLKVISKCFKDCQIRVLTMMTLTPSSSPSRRTSSDPGNPLLCCGICSIKMYKGNFFRNMFRRTHRAIRKHSIEVLEGTRVHQKTLDIESKSHLSPSIEFEHSPTSSRCRYRASSSSGRKSSVISFGDVDTREVHKMMKYINRSKV